MVTSIYNKNIIVASIRIVLSIMIIASLIVFTPKTSLAVTITVSPGESIQAAIDSANPGDTIIVNTGTYYENLTWNKNLTIIGAGQDVTTINGGGVASVITASNLDSSSLEGFTITNGKGENGGGMYISNSFLTIMDCVFLGNSTMDGAEGQGGYVTGNGGDGGGVYNDNSSPTFIGCTFDLNTTGNGADGFVGGNGGDGAGMYNNSASPSIIDCSFTGNSTGIGGTGDSQDGFRGSGGGIFNEASSPTISECTFESNEARHGGGLLNRNGSAPIIQNSSFEANIVSFNGGGIYNISTSSPDISDCSFILNEAGRGGGICNNGTQGSCNPSVDRCMFLSNTAYTYEGGGMYNSFSAPVISKSVFSDNTSVDVGGGICNIQSSPEIINSIFSVNTSEDAGGGIYNIDLCQPVMTNCTFFGNLASSTGGAVSNYESSTPMLANCILWDNTANVSSPEIFSDESSQPIVIYSDIQGGYGNPDDHNINELPLFYDPNINDFHLTANSPCVDTGTNTGAPTDDIDGEPRPVDGDGDTVAITDMGAYELQGGDPVLSAGDTVNLTTTIPIVLGIDVSPASIDFGIVPPGEHSSTADTVDPSYGASDADRTLNLANTGNCDQWITTEITGEERTVTKEKLGYGNGIQTVFGPTDYIPIDNGSWTVCLDDVEQLYGVTVNLATGMVIFDTAPTSGVLVSITYSSKSKLYTENMTFDDAANPPEILASSYARELVDDETAIILSDIYTPVDYPYGKDNIETAQCIFYVEAHPNPGYTLIMGVSGNGVTDPAVGPHSYPIGGDVTITAIPDEGWEFVNWTGDVADPNSATTTVTMDAAKTVIANFTEITTTVTLIMEAPAVTGSGTTNPPPGSHSYDVGEVVTVTAIPDEGSYFVNWTGDVADPASETTTVTMNADKTITANFTVDMGPVITVISPTSGEEVSGTVTIEATATDDIGIVGGDYSIDGGASMAMTPDVTLPATTVTFTADWDSTMVTEGNHTINVAVEDTGGHVNTVSVTVTVNNLPAEGEWGYEVTYVDEQLMIPPSEGPGLLTDTEIRHWSVTNTGVEHIILNYYGGTTWEGDCLHLVYDFGPDPMYVFKDTYITILTFQQDYYDVVTGRKMYTIGQVSSLDGMWEMDFYQEYQWIDTDSYIMSTHVNPTPGNYRNDEQHELVVTGTETVVTAAGTYECNVVEDYIIGLRTDWFSDEFEPVDPPLLVRTEWWDIDGAGLIKWEDYTYDGDITAVLESIA